MTYSRAVAYAKSQSKIWRTPHFVYREHDEVHYRVVTHTEWIALVGCGKRFAEIECAWLDQISTIRETTDSQTISYPVYAKQCDQ
ncbi:hypothetical protein SH668x_001240 [Planctomicrobium sp. SH668]|uniref:hypothetical protein n=1 Tax=Planctomicrobium sp. SH668 TaxID=3448126 RepID=UPI003F5B4D08